MGKINVLSSDVYNKISAGEVVERPANVVKELVENSIDAGSTEIIVEIMAGGLDSIIIKDNGCGILSEDIEKAVLNHSTSKILDADDLFKIQTLGFRGEALASIAAVSDVKIQSKTVENEFGTEAVFENGILKNKIDIGKSTGTIIEVKNLFKYVPARLKFLKTERAEELEIYSTFTKIILSNYNKKLKLIINNKIKIEYMGSTLEDAIKEIYGNEIANNLIKVNYSYHDILITGFVGKPAIAKSSKSAQTLFVNKRYVQNATVSYAVNKVFESYLMKGQFPFFCINIRVNTDVVDVNVHPKKLEVRFAVQSNIFSAVYGAITNAVLDVSSNSGLKSQKSEVEELDAFVDKEASKIDLTKYNFADNTKYYDSNYTFDNKHQEAINFLQNATSSSISSGNDAPIPDFLKEFINSPLDEFGTNFDIGEKKLKILGQIFNEFCIVEKNETVYIIDEHAMHERILFDNYTNEVNQGTFGTMSLMAPFALTLNPKEESNLNALSDDLQKLGFEISNLYKNTYRIDAIPSVLFGINLQKFFDKILSNEYTLSKKENASLIRDKLAREACRDAVKAGQHLTDYEIETLINTLKPETPLLCPHGRPVLIELTKTDLEKMFKRIL